MRAWRRARLTSDTATNPVPKTATDGCDIVEWTAGRRRQPDVYFGTVFEDNAASRVTLEVLVSQGQSDASYTPGLLDFGTTYYWRIDEVNGAPDNTIFKGGIWSFTAEPVGYAIEGIIATASNSAEGAGPENTINGSGLNENDEHSTEASDMWLTTADATAPVWIQYEFDRVYKMHELLVWNYNVQFEPVLGAPGCHGREDPLKPGGRD